MLTDCSHAIQYAWAERAEKAGHPEYFAQLTSGQNSNAVYQACAENSQGVPLLEECEKL